MATSQPQQSTSRRIMNFPKLLLAAGVMMLTNNCNVANGHVAAWHPSMYCFNGTTPGQVDQNANQVTHPLYNLAMKDWWFHHFDGCDQFPPAKGAYLQLPQNGQFTVELAVNRAFTSYSYGGRHTGTFGDGQEHPDFANRNANSSCITEPNIHTQSEANAAGTAFAISYVNDISKVTPQNLVVFSVRYHTPWKRLTTYDVPNLPACPPGGCICAWGWVPQGCGEPNMYMQGFRCMVTNVNRKGPVQAVATAKPPVFCDGHPEKCVQGAKQMIFWNQAEGNNIVVVSRNQDMAGGGSPAPGYNMKCGFKDGAQTDIFLNSGRRPSMLESSGFTSTMDTLRLIGMMASLAFFTGIAVFL